MELVNIYDEYREVNKNYVDFIEELVNKKFEGFSEDFVMGNLENFQNSIGDLKVKADDLQVEEENKDNLKDLKYLIVDTLFLTFDLNNFYKLKEFERFKMRFANYVNKRRREEIPVNPLAEICMVRELISEDIQIVTNVVATARIRSKE